MANLKDIETWIRSSLPGLLAEHRVPGAAVAVCVGDEVVDFAAGVLNRVTGVAATADSVFQIGSITKVWTATLVMQLVDEGRLDLDAPVRRYLPEFVLADSAAATAITVRQLLAHTAGFEGDIFTDTGVGDDCVEKYVATLADVPQLFAPGEMFSYNNAGYCILGRIAEVLRGASYDDCLRRHLFAPLGLEHAAASPYEAILHRAAVGHLSAGPEAEPQLAPVWAITRSNVAAGAMLAMSPRDLISFARLHMAPGHRALSAASVRAMQEPQVDVPYLGTDTSWGLGWELFDWQGGRVVGHDGGTIGQRAFLRAVPERGVAVALLTNGGEVIPVFETVFGHILGELAGVTVPRYPVPSAEPRRVDASRYVGTYASRMAESTVSQDAEGRIWVDQKPTPVAMGLGMTPQRYELLHLRGDTLLAAQAEAGVHVPHTFVGDDGAGHAQYLHTGRADRRLAR
ncbi:serine hydrolase domain-containing protein [Streptomyces sp. NPDC005799]|uniref:serine hydrolase domain-containing protein n=1 Tax=Streptomyces sp. NPDC005799 TaxID=3154678 RepID=UPI0033F117CD